MGPRIPANPPRVAPPAVHREEPVHIYPLFHSSAHSKIKRQHLPPPSLLKLQLPTKLIVKIVLVSNTSSAPKGPARLKIITSFQTGRFQNLDFVNSGCHLGLPGDTGGINLIDLSQQMMYSSESICIRGQTGQSVSLSKRFLKGPGDSWEHWLEDVGLSWEQELGVGCTETQRNAMVLHRKLDWGRAPLPWGACIRVHVKNGARASACKVKMGVRASTFILGMWRVCPRAQ